MCLVEGMSGHQEAGTWERISGKEVSRGPQISSWELVEWGQHALAFCLK